MIPSVKLLVGHPLLFIKLVTELFTKDLKKYNILFLNCI